MATPIDKEGTPRRSPRFTTPAAVAADGSNVLNTDSRGVINHADVRGKASRRPISGNHTASSGALKTVQQLRQASSIFFFFFYLSSAPMH